MLAPNPKNHSICHILQLKIHRLKVHFIKSKMSRLTVYTFLPLDGAHCIKFNFSDRSISIFSYSKPSHFNGSKNWKFLFKSNYVGTHFSESSLKLENLTVYKLCDYLPTIQALFEWLSNNIQLVESNTKRF